MTDSKLGYLAIGAIAVLAVLLLVAGGITAFGNLGAADQRAPQGNGQMGGMSGMMDGSLMGGMMSGGMMSGGMMDNSMMGGMEGMMGGMDGTMNGTHHADDGTSGMGCH